MELEDKILHEIGNIFTNLNDLDNELLSKINELIIYESVKVTDREKTEREAINFLENKLHDLFAI